MFGNKGRNSPDMRSKRMQRLDRLCVRQFPKAEGFGSTFESSAQTVKRQVAFGQDFAARLKVAEGEEYDLL
jgi:hypothetical protein